MCLIYPYIDTFLMKTDILVNLNEYTKPSEFHSGKC